MTLQTLQLSNGDTRYVQAGAGAPVLLLHGVGLQAEAWGPQIAALSADHRVIALNMPGHGGSDLLAAGADLPAYVAWAAEAIRALGISPVAVAGHSMGAFIAAGLAIEHPDLIARVAVLNGVHRRTDAARAAVQARALEIAQGNGDLETPLRRWFGDSASEQLCRAQVANWLSQVSTAGYAAAYSAFAGGDVFYADRWHEIRCPALALTGDGDANSTGEMAQAMAAAAQNGRAVVISGHRHMVNLTAPETVSAALRDWLAMPAAAPKMERPVA